MRKWNRDKKHRCPGCHIVWTYGPKYRFAFLRVDRHPRWWKVYRCFSCGTKFAGWGWR